MSRWVYPWPFFWVLGKECHPEMHFSLPRWFLLAILEARLLIAAVEAMHARLPKSHKHLAGYFNAAIILVLTFLGMTWRNYYDTPLFDQCNLHYHSKVRNQQGSWCVGFLRLNFGKNTRTH